MGIGWDRLEMLPQFRLGLELSKAITSHHSCKVERKTPIRSSRDSNAALPHAPPTLLNLA